jgi:hypothetical protein
MNLFINFQSYNDLFNNYTKYVNRLEIMNNDSTSGPER